MRYSTYRAGRFSPEGHADINAVTLWMLRYSSISILGPEGADLPLEVSWEDVLETMRYNLSVYWQSKARRPYLFLSSAWVEFAVSTLCRILCTVKDGEIISKSVALYRCRSRVPAPFHRLLAEAARTRAGKAKTLYRSPLSRAQDTLSFLRYVQSTGEQSLRGNSK